jgi:hypothetical protein
VPRPTLADRLRALAAWLLVLTLVSLALTWPAAVRLLYRLCRFDWPALVLALLFAALVYRASPDGKAWSDPSGAKSPPSYRSVNFEAAYQAVTGSL